MKLKILFTLLVLFGFLSLFGVNQAKACSCGGGANPCGAFRAEKGVIFTGTVTEVTDSNEKYGQTIQGKARKIRIRVDEIFKGLLPSEIVTSDDGFQCDNYPFKLGGSYLIYADGVLENTENIVKVGLCSGTKPLENAQEDLRFLRPLKEGKTFSLIYGKVEKFVNHKDLPNQPLQNTKIILIKEYSIENGEYKKPKKKDRESVTYTDENGEYDFKDVQPGRYNIKTDLPINLWMPEQREFGAGGKPFCENHSFYAFTDGRISGNVVSSAGIPVGFVELRLSSVSKDAKFYQNIARTDKDGNYTFYGLSEGNYKVHIYLPYYRLDNSKPSPFESGYPYSTYYFGNVFEDREAQIVNLGNIEKLQNINLKMPPFPVKQTVSGTVVWEDGTIPENAVISYRIKKFGGTYQRYAIAKKDGTFSFQIYEEFEYEFIASNNSNEVRGYSEWLSFSKDELKNPIRLVLKPAN